MVSLRGGYHVPGALLILQSSMKAFSRWLTASNYQGAIVYTLEMFCKGCRKTLERREDEMFDCKKKIEYSIS